MGGLNPYPNILLHDFFYNYGYRFEFNLSINLYKWKHSYDSILTTILPSSAIGAN